MIVCTRVMTHDDKFKIEKYSVRTGVFLGAPNLLRHMLVCDER